MSFFHGQMGPKRLELLHELVPKGVIGFLVNPKNPVTDEDLGDVQEAGRKIGVTMRFARPHRG